MTERCRYLIIGGGLEGLAIAWSLAERGENDVIVLERSSLCSGMTGKSSGVVRCHYGVKSLAAMAWYGVQVFSNANTIFGDDIGFRQTGYIVGVSEVNVDPLRANVAMQQQLGIDVELVDNNKAQELWPTAYLDDFSLFAYEPEGGRGDGYMTAMAFGARARQLGATIKTSTPVTQLLADKNDRVYGVVSEDGTHYHADVVILAAGPWSCTLSAQVGVTLPISTMRAQLVLVNTGDPMPNLPVFSDLINLQYLSCEPNLDLLVGNSDHQTPEYIDPDDYSNRADETAIEQAIMKLDQRFPDMSSPRVTGSYVGGYDVTPDLNPIIGPAPVEGLFIAAGFSGHGFKISPAVGHLVADLITSGTTTLSDINPQDFRYSRFDEQRPLRSPHPYVGAGEMR